jgi:hypothetical protein
MDTCAEAVVRLQYRLNDLDSTQGYQALLRPIVQLKQAFETVYQALMHTCWARVTGQPAPQPIHGVWLLLGFCLLSVVVFWLDDYEERLFIGIVVIWGLETSVSRWRYFRDRGDATVYLSAITTGKAALPPLRLRYRRTHCDGRVIQQDFRPDQVMALAITHGEIRGGPFEAHLGWVWRLSLTLQDQSDCLLYEHRHLDSVLKQVRPLQSWCPQAPVQVVGSLGSGPYASARPLHQLVERYRQSHRSTVSRQRQRSGMGYRLHLRWHWQAVGQLCQTLVKQSGFLLFVVVATQVMEWFGGLMYHAARVYGDAEAVGAVWVGAFSSLTLAPRWTDWAEGAIALGAVVINGWPLLQSQQIAVTRDRLCLFRRRRPVAAIATPDITGILMVTYPRRLVVVVGPAASVVIPGLQTEAEQYCLWLALQETVPPVPQD